MCVLDSLVFQNRYCASAQTVMCHYKMTKYALIILTVFFIACSQDSQTDNQNIPAKNHLLDSLVVKLIDNYPDYSKQRRLEKDKSLSTVYEVVSRHFYPSLDSLTFELREHTACGGCWTDQFIYIYNDSTQYVLPLIDEYFYWLVSADRVLNVDSVKNKFCLKNEVNNALKEFNLRDNLAYDSQEKFMDIVMDLMGYQPVYNWDIPKMKEFSKGITQDSSFYNKNCKTKFIDNLKTIEYELNDHKKGRKIYSNLWVTYIVDFGQKSIDLTVLNFECNAQIIF